MPPEMIRHVFSFLDYKCNCCLKPIHSHEDIKHMFKYNFYTKKDPIIYIYCSEDCLHFLN